MPLTGKTSRLDREKRTLSLMIGIYCRKRHHSDTELCEDCLALFDFALFKLDKCPWGVEKPACSKCTIHCYPDDKREKIREVMRFAGPRMLFKYPLLSFLHFGNKS